MDTTPFAALAQWDYSNASRSAILLRLIWPTLAALGYRPEDLRVTDVATDRQNQTQIAFAGAEPDSLPALVEVEAPIPPAAALEFVSRADFDLLNEQAPAGIWTDGHRYLFIAGTDRVAWSLAEPQPFEHLAKGQFNPARLLEYSEGKRLSSEVTQYLKAQMENPASAFINFLAQQTLGVSPSAEQQAQMRPRIKAALAECFTPSAPPPAAAPEETEAEKILRKVRTLLAERIQPERLGLRTTSGYVAILLDSNGRKALCRLHLGPSRQVGFLDANRKEERLPLPENGGWDALKERLEASLTLISDETKES